MSDPTPPHASDIERMRERGRAVREARARAARRAEEAWHQRALQRHGPAIDAREAEGLARELAFIPRWIWRACWAIVADSSGRAAWALWRKVPPVRRSIAICVAFGVVSDGQGGFVARYRMADLRARRVLALAFALHALSAATRRRGIWSGGAVLGLTRRTYCMLLRHPDDPRPEALPHRNTVFGTHRRGATLDQPGQLGYMTALRRAGYCYSRRLPAEVAEPCERFVVPDRVTGELRVWTTARYQLAAHDFAWANQWLGPRAADILQLAVVWTREGIEAALNRLLGPPQPLAA